MVEPLCGSTELLTVGAPRFELGISWPPARRDNQASLRPVEPQSLAAVREPRQALSRL